MSTQRVDLHQLVDRIEETDALDRVGDPLAKVVKGLVPPRSPIKDLLSGSWLGHPLHPLLTDIPIGMFTSATTLDLFTAMPVLKRLFGGAGAARAADRLVDLGLLASVATAAAGASDWSDTNGGEMRVGVVHAAANVLGVLCYGASAVARRRGKRARATGLAVAGMGVMTVGGYLGGYLGYTRGVGVNHAFNEQAPGDWTDVLDAEQLSDGATGCAEVSGAVVLFHRRGDAILAIGGRCTHAGGPLAEGQIDEAACTVTCPWHQSVFRLDTGAVVHGPATVPQAVYDARIIGGRIEVRARQ
jgi:nitrite reductase/ring-hydroxylating ferredoxin subunit/uncharacterized membrane protein